MKPMKQKAKTSAKWDGEQFQAQVIGEQDFPHPDSAGVDLEHLMAQLERGNRRLSSMSDKNQAGGNDGLRLALTLFDGGKLELAGATLAEILSQLPKIFADTSKRWSTGELIHGDARAELRNPNRETVRTLTDGVAQWRNRRRSCGVLAGSKAAKDLREAMMAEHRAPVPRERLEWVEWFFKSLPKVADLVIDTIHEPEKWEGFAVLANGERIEAEGASEREVWERLDAESKRRRARIRSGGTGLKRQEGGVYEHPLNQARFDVAVWLAKARELFSQHGDDSAAARGWQMGLELGMAIGRYDRIAVRPEIKQAAAMDAGRAGGHSKDQAPRLKAELARWLGGKTAGVSRAALAAEFFDFATAARDQYRVKGTGIADKRSSIRHRSDKRALKLSHIERNLIPRLLEK